MRFAEWLHIWQTAKGGEVDFVVGPCLTRVPGDIVLRSAAAVAPGRCSDR